jgi:hypothetical protein
MPRESWRVIVPPETPEPAAYPRNHDLEVSPMTARPLSKQATTASHNPILLFRGPRTVPPRSAPTNLPRPDAKSLVAVMLGYGPLTRLRCRVGGSRSAPSTEFPAVGFV